jgi:hypothetical protein
MIVFWSARPEAQLQRQAAARQKVARSSGWEFFEPGFMPAALIRIQNGESYD